MPLMHIMLRSMVSPWEHSVMRVSFRSPLSRLIGEFEDIRFTYMNRAKNAYADALATLASWLSIPEGRAVDVSVSRVEQPAHCMTIEEADPVEELPWYHDIKVFLKSSSPPPGTSATDRKTLAHLALKYVIGTGHLYRRSYNQMLLRCVDKKEADTLMLQVHAGTYGPHMNGVLLAKKIILQGYF